MSLNWQVFPLKKCDHSPPAMNGNSIQHSSTHKLTTRIIQLNVQRRALNSMKKITVGLARSIWLFDTNELNPTGKSIFPDLMVWLGEKYSFQTFPKSIADLDQEKKGYLFKTGEFQSAADGAITVNFSFFGDGVVAETWSSTENGDDFLDDVLRSAAGKFGLAYRPEMIRTKTYISELTIELDYALSDINPKILRFCEALNGIFAKHHLRPFEMTGMVFGPDTSASSYKPPSLQIERKAATPFTENRFWSKSPFTTADHLRALEEFEKLLVP